MLRSLAMPKNNNIEIALGINNNCKNRIIPAMLNEVKTEAILVFARTALERYFIYIAENDYHPVVGSEADTQYVYGALKNLRDKLQDSAVNADYLVNLVQSAKQHPQLRKLAKHEEPLINYYDSMAHKVANHYRDKPSYIPEFLVVCVLHAWIVEEEKSTNFYPYLNDFDFGEIIHIFETNRKDFQKDGECIIADTFKISELIIKTLKNKKYKINGERVSKIRKKK